MLEQLAPDDDAVKACAWYGAAPETGVPTRRRFLNHSGGDITDHYIRDRALGQLQLAEQETISAHIIKALGSPRGLV